MSWLLSFSAPQITADALHGLLSAPQATAAKEDQPAGSSSASSAEDAAAPPSPPPPQLVDVRTTAEFEAGHILGALHCSIVPPWSLRERLEALQLQKDRTVVVICLSAHRSPAATHLLLDMGYAAAVQLAGGMTDWRARGLPEERTAAATS